MQVDAVIKTMLQSAADRISGREVSRMLGRADSWARTVSMPGRSPSLATVAAIACALGYRVQIVDSEGRTVCEVDAPGED